MKKLILLTKHYPYDNGEEFIENEIKYLSNAFDEVIIISTAVANIKVVKDIPNNVKAFAFKDQQYSYIRYAKYILRSFFYNDKLQEIELKKVFGVRQKMAVRYVYSRAKFNINRIANSIRYLTLNDDIILYSYWFGDLTLSALLLSQKLFQNRAIIISRAHGYDLYSERNLAEYTPFAEYLLKNINCIFPCSDNGTKYIQKKWNPPINKVKTAHLGTIDYGNSTAHSRDIFTIVTCSSINEVKRVNLLAEALSIVSDELKKKIHWICIGDGPLLGSIRKYAVNYLKKVSIDFVGRLSNKDVLQLYLHKNISLFVNTSSNEGLPVSIMEAISFGIPVLATDVGGTKEIVIENMNGYLLSKDTTPKIIANKIKMIFELSDNKYSLLCSNARLIWERDYNASVNYTAFINEILSLKISE